MSKSDSDSSSFSKTWELNIYELNRMPHEIIYDETEIAVSPKILQNELMCPICLDILKQTMTTKECLHRFCHDCIITALRAGNKECPTCRKKLISKRSLRPDPNFDGIIAKIYPNREEYDAIHEKVLEKLNKKHLTSLNGSTNTNSKPHRAGRQASISNSNNPNTNSSSTTPATSATPNQTQSENTVNSKPSTKSDLNSAESTSSASSTSSTIESNNQLNSKTPQTANLTTVPSTNTASIKQTDSSSNLANHRGVKRTAHNNSDDSDLESRASTEQSSLHLQNDLDEVEIVLKPHPTKETSLSSKRFLKTTSNATINHLSKYLWTRLCVEAATSASSANLDPLASNNGNTGGTSTDDFQLFISPNEKLPNSFQLLSSTFTLEQVIDKYWKLNRPVELFYVHVNKPNTTNLNDLNQNSNSNSSVSCSSNLNNNNTVNGNG